MRPDEGRLAEILVRTSYLRTRPGEPPFRLASGKESSFYFDCQRATSFAEALPLMAEAFWKRLLPEVTSVGGLTRGADPIALAIAYFSSTQGRPVNAFSVRKTQKDHGTRKWIEGWAAPGETVALVEDVITTGGSVILAIDRCREAEVQIAQVLVLVDREEGGIENIKKRLGTSIPVDRVFTKSQLDPVEKRIFGPAHLSSGGA